MIDRGQGPVSHRGPIHYHQLGRDGCCLYCGGKDYQLTLHCSRARLKSGEKLAIEAGFIDYQNGSWVVYPSLPKLGRHGDLPNCRCFPQHKAPPT